MSTTSHLRPTTYAVAMFDLDGTLIETMQGFADLAADVMVARHGDEREWARRRYLETSGIPFCKQLEAIHPRHPANRQASDEFEQHKLGLAAAAEMDTATRSGLEGLRAFGMRLVVSSNTGQALVDEFVAREPFRFDLALGFDSSRDLAKGEPHVARVCADFGVRRENIVFVGDSLKDHELAAASGVAFVGRLGTFGLSDFRRQDARALLIASVSELPTLLRAAALAA